MFEIFSNDFFSASYTITFALFKGFPWKKVPFYIASQIFGAFLGTLAVYGAYKSQLDAIAAALVAAGEGAVIFSPLGPAGALALYPGIGQPMKYICKLNASQSLMNPTYHFFSFFFLPLLFLFLFLFPFLSLVVVNEFVANVFLSIVVFSVLDSSNIFVCYASAPLLISFAYMAAIWSFGANSLALNSGKITTYC